MYGINRAVAVRPNEQPEEYHVFTEDSAFVYQLFLWTKEELRGKAFPKGKARKGSKRSSKATH